MDKGVAERVITIERHILEQQPLGATGTLTSILYDLALVGKLIARETTRAALEDILGLTGRFNVQGEEVAKLDQYAHMAIVRMTEFTGRLAVLASEGSPEIIPIPGQLPTGRYVLLFDPLDGSSNIDYAVSIGTIFSILRRRSADGTRGTTEDCLQRGRDIVAAGYILYGPPGGSSSRRTSTSRGSTHPDVGRLPRLGQHRPLLQVHVRVLRRRRCAAACTRPRAPACSRSPRTRTSGGGPPRPVDPPGWARSRTPAPERTR